MAEIYQIQLVQSFNMCQMNSQAELTIFRMKTK